MIFLRNKKLINWFLLFSLAVINFLPLAAKPMRVQAAGGVDNFISGIEKTGGEIGYDVGVKDSRTQIASLIGKIVGAIVAFVGVIFMVLIWMGGFDIIGAGGNEETLKKGKNKIKNGAIGVLVVFCAYLFAVMILNLVSGGSGVFNIFKY